MYYAVRVYDPGKDGLVHYQVRIGPRIREYGKLPDWPPEQEPYQVALLGRFETREGARECIRRVTGRYDPAEWESWSTPPDRETWVPTNVEVHRLYRVNWEAEELDLKLPYGVELLALEWQDIDVEKETETELSDDWKRVAEAHSLDPAWRDNREAIIWFLEGEGWHIAEVSHDGWRFWACVGERPRLTNQGGGHA
ncbi:MAG: hypothetical protein ABFE07_24235 [Armatimonadia bacterium]